MRPRRVSELMNPDVVALGPETSIREAQALLARKRVGGAPVVDDHGRVLGVVSQHDLAERQADRGSAGEAGRFFTTMEEFADLADVQVGRGSEPVSTVMSRRVHAVSRETGAAVAANIMRERRIHRLLVTERGMLVGVVTSLDLLRVVEEVC